MKNKFFGSVFNITTMAMCMMIGKTEGCYQGDHLPAGLLVPFLSAANISYLVNWEFNMVCMRPLAGWVLASTISLVGFLSLLYK